jgi:hypothetical protein
LCSSGNTENNKIIVPPSLLSSLSLRGRKKNTQRDERGMRKRDIGRLKRREREGGEPETNREENV